MLSQLDSPNVAFNWSLDLQMAAGSYLAEHKIEARTLLPVDAILMLLRIGTKEALEHVQELTGKPIQKCPAAVPPWPPKPVARSTGPRLAFIAPNPCMVSTDMHRRYDLLKIGFSKEQLLARGIQMRDLRVWHKADHIRFTT